MCAKVCARYECATLWDPDCFMRPTALARPYTFFTFSSSGRRARTSKMRFYGRVNVSLFSFLLSFFIFVCTIYIIFVHYLAHIGGKLNVGLAYFHAARIRASLLAAKRKYIFASHRRYAISEKLIIHLCRRYVFPVDARCPFNAFATTGSMRGVLVSATLSFLPPFLLSRAIPLSCADWKLDIQSRLNQ